MKNYVQKGENLTLAAPYTVASGGGVLIGDIFGVAAGDAQNGAEVDLVTSGVFTLAKVSTDAFTIGAPVFWDDSAKLATTDDDGAANPRIGVAVTAAANPSGFVNVKLEAVQWLPEPA
jgi:predicted RecA/RadA family phage recombinase